VFTQARASLKHPQNNTDNSTMGHGLVSSLLFVLLFSVTAGATDRFNTQLQCLANAVAHLANVHPDAVKHVPYDEGPSQFMLSEDEMPWTSSYFPMDKKGIAVRWQDSDSEGLHDFDDPGKLLAATDRDTVIRRLKALGPARINQLSAVEKLDILDGNYDFSATKTELRVRGPERDPPPDWWEGFCNGVCAASINLKEPTRPVTLKNREGIEVTFEPNDIKALANASYFFVEKYAQVGSPNRTKLNVNFETLPDPGALDWALTHYLGGLHKPFAADKAPGPQIWNHVVVGYKRNLEQLKPAENGMPPDVKWTVIANVHMTYTGGGIDHHTANRPTTARVASGEMTETRYYRYELFLDEDKKIVGGRWPQSEDPSKTTVDAPDFLWFPAGRGTDSKEGYNPYISFDRVLELVKRSSGK
jgi:hypothetical protein